MEKGVTFAIPFGDERDFYARSLTRLKGKYKQVPSNTSKCDYYFKRASILIIDEASGRAKNVRIYNEEFDPGSG